MFKQALRVIGRPAWKRVQFRIDAAVGSLAQRDGTRLANAERDVMALKRDLEDANRRIDSLALALDSAHLQVHGRETVEEKIAEMFSNRVFVPADSVVPADAPFMEYSTCSAIDVMHPRFAHICSMLGREPVYHRKVWEWAYIIHHLERLGMLQNGRRGLCFGVGQERLPALFAKFGCEIVATDAPPEIGIENGWQSTDQYSSAIEHLRAPNLISDEDFEARVSYQHCDMNAIDPALRGFDFNWSSCCFEHLGSLEAGLQFVINSMDTLKPGGIAIHTTEYNLTSNDGTVEDGPTVIYRKRDIENLVRRLEALGYQVEPFKAAPHSHPLDFHIDAPPYKTNPHLKLRLMGYSTTSVGICVRKP